MGGVFTHRLGVFNSSAALTGFGIAQFDLGTSTGTLNVTDTDLGGITPVAAIMIATQHRQSQDPQTSGTCGLSVGFYDGTTDYSAGIFAENNQATANSNRKNSTAFYDIFSSVGSDGYGSGTSFIADGIRITRDNATSLDYTGFMLMLAGAGWQAAVGTTNMGNTTPLSVDVTAPGFEPDVVILLKAGDTNVAPTTGPTVDANFEFGICVNDGADTQHAMSWAQDDLNGSGAARQGVWNNCISKRVSAFSGNQLWTITCGTFDASGFTLTTDTAAGSQEYIWIALKNAGKSFKLLPFDSPVATGSYAITGAGFQPSFGLAVTTNLEAVNPVGAITADATLMAGLGISAFTTLTEKAASLTMSDDGSSVTQSDVKTYALQCENGTDRTASGDPLQRATLTSFDSDGLTFNYSPAPSATKKGFMLLVS